jgi:hypothetical protein
MQTMDDFKPYHKYPKEIYVFNPNLYLAVAYFDENKSPADDCIENIDIAENSTFDYDGISDEEKGAMIVLNYSAS